MQIVLLRVGIDTGSGGAHGPRFEDGTFEYISIPDRFRGTGRSQNTYGNTLGTTGLPLVNYLPISFHKRMHDQPIHIDPEFKTFTYGDPTTLKGSLRKLNHGDLLVFYASLQDRSGTCNEDCRVPIRVQGLKGQHRAKMSWHEGKVSLYVIGFFEVARAGRAEEFSEAELSELFFNNFHVKHKDVFESQKRRLVLVKGSNNSRLLTKAYKISAPGTDRRGKALHRLSPEIQDVFGDFQGKTSIQRCPPRWVAPAFVQGTASFVWSLR